jgi:hypothetical protein
MCGLLPFEFIGGVEGRYQAIREVKKSYEVKMGCQKKYR